MFPAEGTTLDKELRHERDSMFWKYNMGALVWPDPVIMAR